ncbi:MAG: bifunctional riboflavin kinase/FAD synthetase [Gammaproteobacteria bacterium]
MELIRGLHNLRERHRGCVLSIGNFDGFHRGHAALVARLRQHATKLKVPVAVQVFEPTPREFFARRDAPGRIATFRDKLAQLAAAGVDRVLCVRFGERFAAIEAARYVEEVLAGRLGVKAVVVGDDFRFGAGRGGDLALLQRLGSKLGFEAEALGAVVVNGERASSTAVREALKGPDFARAQRLLGRPYALGGRVRRGAQLGRKLGMPTVNVPMRRRPALRLGIYAVRVRAAGRDWDGVASLGVRPMLEKSGCVLEAHVFGEPGSLYGQPVEVRFVKFLRDERRFESFEALAAQMQQDGAQARAALGQA